MAEEFQLQFTALKTKKAKIADGRQSRKKKCTIDFGLTKELDYANFGVETKTAEKKEDVGMNIGTSVSYTHLDVYKRQGIYSIKKPEGADGST